MSLTPEYKLNLASLAFWGFHLCLLGIFFFPINSTALWLVFGSYFGRMFFITGGYHRYFSHRSFSTSRFFQFFLAFMALTSSQKGVMWWAAHHRAHHRNSDRDEDVHTPRKGFLWSHCGWFLSSNHEKFDEVLVRDWMQYPELRWLEKNWAVPVFIYGLGLLFFFGWNGVFWGLGVSTVMLWHGTFTINSLSHVWGSKRYETNDHSRNNALLALITLGEGWHNNHHRYPVAARNGFFWWEIDVTYLILKLLSFLGLVWNLRPVPKTFSNGSLKQLRPGNNPRPSEHDEDKTPENSQRNLVKSVSS